MIKKDSMIISYTYLSLLVFDLLFQNHYYILLTASDLLLSWYDIASVEKNKSVETLN